MSDASHPSDCIFCKIVSGEFDTEFVAENEHAVAFRDLHPQAPSHVLVVPRQHLAALREFGPDQAPILVKTMALVVDVARAEGLLDGGGYRLVVNDGPDAGQTVFHAHFHVMGGEPLVAMG